MTNVDETEIEFDEAGSLEYLNLRLTGVTAMLQNNARVINPLSPYFQAKKQFTKADQGSDAYHRNDWEGAMYFHPEIGPYIPSSHIEVAMAKASSKIKRGYKALFTASVRCVNEQHPIEYKGPRTLDGMWKQREKFVDIRNVRIARSGVMKCRPIFQTGWTADVALSFISNKDINATTVLQAMDLAGKFCGIGDYLPRFGRFNVERID